MIMLTKHLFSDIALKNRFKTLVLYATETGRSKNYAGIVNEIFSHAFDSRVRSVINYKCCTIVKHNSILSYNTCGASQGIPSEFGDKM